MKFKLRFFQLSKKARGPYLCDRQEHCFSTIESEYVPKRGDLIFISDDDINRGLAKPGRIYQVHYVIYCGDSKEGFSIAEITVKRTKL